MPHHHALPLTVRDAVIHLHGFFDGELARIDAELDQVEKGPGMTLGSIVRRKGQELTSLRREKHTLLRTQRYVVDLVEHIRVEA